MANNPDGVARFLSPNVYDFLQATVLREVRAKNHAESAHASLKQR